MNPFLLGIGAGARRQTATFKIVDSRTGAPVRDAEIVAEFHGGPDKSLGKTPSWGSAEIQMPATLKSIRVSKPGYAAWRISWMDLENRVTSPDPVLVELLPEDAP